MNCNVNICIGTHKNIKYQEEETLESIWDNIHAFFSVGKSKTTVSAFKIQVLVVSTVRAFEWFVRMLLP